MINTRKEIKRMESKEKATNQLKELNSVSNSIDSAISKFYIKAKDRLLKNDETGFEIIANSIFYFQEIQNVIQTVSIRFETYLTSVDTMFAIEGIRPVLRETAKLMNSFPNLNKNSKDFRKFKRALMRGQLNMKAMTSMMSSINPAEASQKSPDELQALKERILINENPNKIINGNDSRISQNEDFFNVINKD